MDILITYYSETGNTRKVAEAIKEALDEESVSLVPIDEVQDNEYFVIFCGFPVHAHSVPVPVQGYLKNMRKGQKIALFSTHGSLRGGRMPKEAIKNAIGLAKKAKILGSFTCRGQVRPEIIDDLMNEPKHKAWAVEASSAKGHPDKMDIEDAKFFARNMKKKTQTIRPWHTDKRG